MYFLEVKSFVHKIFFSIANYEIVHGEEKAKNYAANNVKKSGPDYTATSPRENPNTDWRTQNRLNAQREAGAGKSGTTTLQTGGGKLIIMRILSD